MATIKASAEACRRMIQAGEQCLRDMDAEIAERSRAADNEVEELENAFNEAKRTFERRSGGDDLNAVREARAEFERCGASLDQAKSDRKNLGDAMEASSSRIRAEIGEVNSRLEQQLELILERISERGQ